MSHRALRQRRAPKGEDDLSPTLFEGPWLFEDSLLVLVPGEGRHTWPNDAMAPV